MNLGIDYNNDNEIIDFIGSYDQCLEVSNSINDNYNFKTNKSCSCEDRKKLELENELLKKSLKEAQQKNEILSREKIELLKALSVSHKFGIFIYLTHIVFK